MKGIAISVILMLTAFSAFQAWIIVNEATCRERATTLFSNPNIETSWMPRRGCSWRLIGKWQTLKMID